MRRDVHLHEVPDADVLPADGSAFRRASRRRSKADPALKHVHLVSVSFDPITDTPPVLKKHAKELGADLTRWTFLTGDRDEIDQFASRFGVSVAPRAERSARHHAQPADRDRRRRRQAGEGLHRQRVDARAGARGSQGPCGSQLMGRGLGSHRRCRRRVSRPRERRLIATPAHARAPCSATSTALPYNKEPGGRATLRSFRGVVRARLRALSRGGALRRRRPRAARLPAAGPQLRVDRRSSIT